MFFNLSCISWVNYNRRYFCGNIHPSLNNIFNGISVPRRPADAVNVSLCKYSYSFILQSPGLSYITVTIIIFLVLIYIDS